MKAKKVKKAPSEAEVIFFDVGQGHCTLVSIPGEPLLLVDAGSTGLRAEIDNFKEIQIKKIQEKITSLLPDTDTDKKHTINVIISHGDLDHYSWLKEIFPKAERDEKFKGKKISLKILCGGREADYSTEFATHFPDVDHPIDTIRYLAKNTRDDTKANNNVEKANEVFNYNKPKSYCRILAARTMKDKNTNSIVVRCEYEEKSLILTGDATHTTVDGIKATDAKSTILQMAHHGATSDNSNSTAWFKKVKPQYVVCSSGEREDYKHPDWQSLENLNQAMKEEPTIKLNDNDTKAHVVRFHRQYADYVKLEAMQPIGSATTSAYSVPSGSINTTLHPFMFFASNYIFYITTLGIYNTTDAGDISFIWETNDFPVQVITARGPEFSATEGSNAIIKTAEKMLTPSAAQEEDDDATPAPQSSEKLNFRFSTDKSCLAIKLPKGFKAKDILTPGAFKWKDIYELDASDVTFYSTYDPAGFLTHMTNLRRFKLPTLSTGSDPAHLTAITARFGTKGIQ